MTGPWESPADSSTDDDPQQRLLAQLLGEIDAGLKSFEDAVRENPEIETRLREMESLRRLLEKTHESAAPEAPESLGEFRIVGVIGKGGMGVVYRAYHDRLKRHVAVKTIRPSRDPASASERFEREQKALARLHQTCIVPIYAAGVEGSDHYFVMPYIEGASLRQVVDRLRKGFTPSDSNDTTLFSMVSVARREAAATTATASLGKPAPSADPTGDGNDAAAPVPTKSAYWRSCARVIAEAAEAMEHAHRRDVFHRDLKPNNIMLSDDGRVWIIDFGLAAFQQTQTAAVGGDGAPPEKGTLTHAALGTWSYMAPEQFSLVADARSDVWGLGVTLYELLTLRRAFAHRSSSDAQLAKNAERPPYPISISPQIPQDLAAICWKAMADDPASRYQSTAALAEDIRRFLRDDEVVARPRKFLERTARWMDRHWTLTAFLLTLAVALPAIIGLQYRAGVKARAELAERQRQLMLGEIDGLIHGERLASWSRKAFEKIREAAAIRKDAALRDAVVAASTSMDAELIDDSINDYGASSAAYSPDGKRLVLGGADKRFRYPPTPAKVWNLSDPKPTFGKAQGNGLVAFMRDGTPIQLSADSHGGLRRVHVLSGETLREFKGLEGADRIRRPTTALSRDGELVAASYAEENVTLVWTDRSEPHRLPVGATALAFSDDGLMLAAGTKQGSASIWSTSDGRKLGEMTFCSQTIQALTFDRGAALFENQARGRLAMGSFGRVGIFDLATRRTHGIFETSEHDFKHLVFSPDDSRIVVDGVFYDAAAGRLLLSVAPQSGVVAISPTEAEMCTADATGFMRPSVTRWSLKNDLGGRTLHGLSTPAGRLTMSRNGNVLAAISRDWQVGVWSLETGRLLRLLDLEEGLYTDNAAIALNDDGSQLAAASGKVVGHWNVATGRLLRHWKLPPGIGSELAFTPDGGLRLARLELKSRTHYPVNPYRFPEHPRTVRVYDLLGRSPETPIREIDDFARGTIGRAMTPDGDRLLVDGIGARDKRTVRLYELPSGRLIHEYETQFTRDYHGLRADPTGRFMVFMNRDEVHEDRRVIGAADGAMGDLAAIGSLGPNLHQWLGVVHGESGPGYFVRGRTEPLFLMPHFTKEPRLFSADGRFLASATDTGAIAVLDLHALEGKFKQLGID